MFRNLKDGDPAAAAQAYRDLPDDDHRAYAFAALREVVTGYTAMAFMPGTSSEVYGRINERVKAMFGVAAAIGGRELLDRELKGARDPRLLSSMPETAEAIGIREARARLQPGSAP
jgi:hypothetical protein